MTHLVKWLLCLLFGHPWADIRIYQEYWTCGRCGENF
jgi:hypothetical protein